MRRYIVVIHAIFPKVQKLQTFQTTELTLQGHSKSLVLVLFDKPPLILVFCCNYVIILYCFAAFISYLPRFRGYLTLNAPDSGVIYHT